MKFISKLAAVAAVTTLAVGGGATVASAYSISGGTYTSAMSSTVRLTLGGSYSYTCTSTSFSGVATGADSMAMTPATSGCAFYGFPWTTTQSGAWNLTVTGGDGLGMYYYGDLEIPAGVTTTWNLPIVGCTVVISGPQTFRHGVGGNVIRMINTSTGVALEMKANNIAYTATSCPYSSASNGLLNTGNAGTGSATPISIPGITVS